MPRFQGGRAVFCSPELLGQEVVARVGCRAGANHGHPQPLPDPAKNLVPPSQINNFT